MKRKFTIPALIVLLLLLTGAATRKIVLSYRFRAALAQREANILERKRELRDGDIIFQTSLSGQSKAIQEATGSEYSHCGIIYRDSRGYRVFEAVQPVKSTPLDQWIARGKGSRYIVKRLNNADAVLTEESLTRMRREAKRMVGKDYDLTFGWSDQKIYCSELVWKIYHRALGIELGELQKLGEFDLSGKAVREKLRERYGDTPPLDEPVISPSAIYECEALTTVSKGGVNF